MGERSEVEAHAHHVEHGLEAVDDPGQIGDSCPLCGAARTNNERALTNYGKAGPMPEPDGTYSHHEWAL